MPRKVWVREWLARKREVGQYDGLLTDFHKEDHRGYKNYLRITPVLFQEMVEKLDSFLSGAWLWFGHVDL